MHKSIFREALLRAWRLVYKNTSLWLLGLLSVLFAGSFGMGNFISQLMVTMGTGGNAGWLLYAPRPHLGVSTLSAAFWLIWLIGVLCVIAIAVIYISVSAKSALLIAVADYYKNEAMPKLSKIWNNGLKFFWKIFTIEVIRKVILCVIVVAFGIIWIELPYYQSFWNKIINIAMLSFSVILGWVVCAVTVFASGYTVIDGKPLGSAFKKAWKLFHDHLLVSLEISAILTIVDLILILVFAAIVSFSFLPSLFVWLLAGAFGSTALAIFGMIFGFVIFIIALVILGAVYNTYYTSVWMYLFMKMHHEGIMSRLFHHVGKLFNK